MCVLMLCLTDAGIRREHAIEKEAVKEYWEKRGGQPGHH